MTNSSVTENHASSSSGGLAVAGNSVVVDSVVVTGNSSDGSVGGIYVATLNEDSSAIISNSRVSNNVASDIGGIFSISSPGGTLTISRTTVTENVGENVGGLNRVSGNLNIESSTISGNTGAGVYVGYGLGFVSLSASLPGSTFQPAVPLDDFSEVAVSHSTISGNSLEGITKYENVGCTSTESEASLSVCSTSLDSSALSPAASAQISVTLTLDHVLAADNGLEDIAFAAQASWSLIEKADAAVVAGPGTQIGVDPGLLPLSRISDTVSVVPIAFGSAAWNAGSPLFVSPPATDQRGLPRIVDIVDIGAYEVQEALVVPVVVPVVIPAFTG